MRVFVVSAALIFGVLVASAQLLSASVAWAQTGSTAPSPAKPLASAPAKSASPNKSAVADAKAECIRLWDSGTHMSKQQWSSTCDRIQTRLDNLKVENLDVMGTGVRKKPGIGKQGSIDRPTRPN